MKYGDSGDRITIINLEINFNLTDPNMLEAHINWLFFNVVLALLPLLINLLLMFIGKIKINWIQLFKEGELFFFSSTISASSIGTLLFEKPSNLALALASAYLLIVILIVSTGMFALQRFLKLQNYQQINKMVDEKIFSKYSLFTALLSIFLGYITFLLVQ